jgi:hypothetical protein
MDMSAVDALNLIMLSAMYENGGNTTHRLLDGHPQLFVYPFESQMGTGVGNDHLTSAVPSRYRWCEFSLEGTPEQDYESFWDEEMKTLLRAPKRSKFSGVDMQIDEADRKAEFVTFAKAHPRSRAALASAFFHSTFTAWKNVRRTGRERYWVGYNPAQILDGEKILADFPTGHILHVVRNPWSGYADTKKRPFPLSLSKYAWLWSQCQLAALTARDRHPDRVHVVRFEDMIVDVKAALGPFLERAGLEWSETLHVPSWNGRRLEQVYPWGTIRTPTPQANKATMDELSADEKRDMASQIGVMGRLLGYGDLIDETK